MVIGMSVDCFELDAALAAVAAFGLPDDVQLVFVKRRENLVWRVRSDGVDRSLRMHRIGHRTDAQLASEVALMAGFNAAGIRTPTPIRTPGGDYVATLTDGAGRRRQATMQDWIPSHRVLADSAAVFDGAASPSAQELSLVGTLLGRMHNAAEKQRMVARGRPAWDADGLVGPGALWGSASRLLSLSTAERSVLGEAEQRLARELRTLPRTFERFGAIHADFTFENLLVVDGGLAVLDFDDAGDGWYLFDLATPFFWCTGNPDAPRHLESLVSGYAASRSLTEEDVAAWHPLLLARALSYLGWSSDRQGDPVSEYHDRVLAPRIVAAAQHYLDTGTTGWPSLRAVERTANTQ